MSQRRLCIVDRQRTECNRVDILIEDQRDQEGKVEGHEAFGTKVVGKNLKNVRNDMRSDTN
jgi:hypothetical protein